MTESQTDIRTRYLRAAGADPVRAAELLARDLAHGERRINRAGHSPEEAMCSAIETIGLDATELSIDLLTGRLEAWLEGKADTQLDGDAVLRCPECCSEVDASEVDPASRPSDGAQLRCGNCDAQFARSEAYVAVGEVES